MHSSNRWQWLTGSLLIGAILAPSSVSAASGDVLVGTQLGGSSLAADTEGPGAAFSSFDHGTTLSGSVLAGYEGSYGDRAYRITGTLGHAKWDNARSLEALGGVDFLWRQADGSGVVYAGPRVGAVRFSDDITDDINTEFAWGAEMGALTTLGSAPSSNGRPLSVGLFLRHTVIDGRQSGVASNGLERDIRVSGQTWFGFQVLLPL
ncbi:hypothetical protein QPM17_09450 [Marinobacter sp. TBZ242]|uniref:Outer membrane protein beta-barrel domain-containing protein n=1 Tax=Marinobacter azerbaijanicus TaxID=3050455 RepID=A0ABT7ICF8_9GAMM|nr:hypothetical protein [Marinobacter sp. TBZ242]MDL0431353.1 hypothetical protein [Marinobacter sp. TBZ242]